MSAIDVSVRVPLPLPVYVASLISPIMPLSNMARNCFKQGRVEDMIAMWVVIVVMTVTPTLV
jgi:hypothetical protein